MVDVLKRSSEALWLDYQFLTREITKFVEQQDYETVSDLIEQRDQLQEIISEQDDSEFRQSERGKLLMQEIYAENKIAMQRLQFLLNNAKRQRNVSQAYETNLRTFDIGDNMNRKT